VARVNLIGFSSGFQPQRKAFRKERLAGELIPSIYLGIPGPLFFGRFINSWGINFLRFPKPSTNQVGANLLPFLGG